MTGLKPTIIAAFIIGLSASGAAFAADKAAAKQDKTVAPSSGAAAPSGEKTAAGTRDWGKVDKNNDNLIQPEEMEAWLKQAGPQAKDDTGSKADSSKADDSSSSKDKGAAGPTGAAGKSDKDMAKSKSEGVTEGGKTEGKPTTQSGDAPK